MATVVIQKREGKRGMSYRVQYRNPLRLREDAEKDNTKVQSSNFQPGCEFVTV